MPALCVPAMLPRNALCIVSQPKDPHDFSLTRVHRRKVAANAGFHALTLIPEAFFFPRLPFSTCNHHCWSYEVFSQIKHVREEEE
jgi:hypothetical protein